MSLMHEKPLSQAVRDLTKKLLDKEAELTRLRAENDRLKAALKLYEDSDSTQEADALDTFLRLAKEVRDDY